MKRVFTYIIFCLIASTFAGCGLTNNSILNPTSNQALNGQTKMSYFSAYQQSVYPVVTNHCVGCHGVSQSPLFATSNIQSSIDFTKPYLDFGNIPNSLLVVRSKDNHCGQSVSHSNCNTNGSEMLAAVNALYENGVKTIDASPIPQFPIATSTQVIPTSANFVTLMWDLSSISAAYTGITFTVEVQDFDAFSYRIRNPKFTSVSGGVMLQVAGIKPLLNGSYNPANDQWNLVSTTINTLAPGVVLSPNLIIMTKDQGTGDLLSFAFDALSLP